MKKTKRKRKRGNSCLQWSVKGWKAGSGSGCFPSLENVRSLGFFLQLIVRKMCPKCGREGRGCPWGGAAPLAFAVGVWGQGRGWQWPWCQLAVPCSVRIEGISVLAPQSNALLPSRLWSDASSLDCPSLAAKNPWANFAKRPQFLCETSLLQPPLRESSESGTRAQIVNIWTLQL